MIILIVYCCLRRFIGLYAGPSCYVQPTLGLILGTRYELLVGSHNMWSLCIYVFPPKTPGRSRRVIVEGHVPKHDSPGIPCTVRPLEHALCREHRRRSRSLSASSHLRAAPPVSSFIISMQVARLSVTSARCVRLLASTLRLTRDEHARVLSSLPELHSFE